MSYFLYAKCPKCGDKDGLDVAVTLRLRLTKEGIDDDTAEIGDHEYTSKSLTSCGACGHSGRLSSFVG